MATDAENQANSDTARERRNAKQRAARAAFQPVDDATKITVTELGRREIPQLPKTHKNGNSFNRNLNYMKLLESPTVAAHKSACKAAGLITGKEDLRRAEKAGWVVLREPGKPEEIPSEKKILIELAAEISNLGITEGEERKRIVSHYRWERNSVAARAAKESAGYKCEVCNEQMGVKYGHDIGADFAEAHHKIPLSEIRGRNLIISAEHLVCVCANCHRMLHRLIRDGIDDAVGQLKTRVKQAMNDGVWSEN